MAELGLAANLAGVIGAGLALSKGLYDFASVLGSASKDIKDLATDIGLFCSVLKYVQTTLTRAKAYRLSMSALQTAEDIIDRSQIIFKDLQASIDKLRKGDAKIELVTRVKWYFKEKRVLLIHEQLKTCTATLHLMLTTLTLAQKIASKRLSLDSEPEDDQDSQDRLMAHTLFRTQQAANERLAAVEDDLVLEERGRQLSPSSPQDQLTVPSPSSPAGGTDYRHRRNRSSRIIDGAVHSPAESSSLNLDMHKRVSVIVGGHTNRLSLITGLTRIDENRLSILQTDELLRNWTDQSDPLAAGDELVDGKYEDPSSQNHDLSPAIEDISLINPPREGTETSSPGRNEPVDSNYSDQSSAMKEKPRITINTTKTTVDHEPKPTVEIHKSFRVTVDDPCWKVLPAALKKYNIQADWRQYKLLVVYGDKQREIALEEKPLALFKELAREGKNTMFVLRKISALEASQPHIDQTTNALPGGVI